MLKVKRLQFKQNLLLNRIKTSLIKFIPEAVFEEKGAEEKHFVAKIPLIDLKVYVYLDSAEIVSPSLNIHFERANSATPEDLTMKLIKELSNAF